MIELVQPVALRPEDLDRLRLPGNGAVDVASIERTLAIYPGRSLWIPATREFIIVGPWRHREEIASAQSISAVRHPELILARAIETAKHLGAEAFVIMEWSESRPDPFYRRVGLDHIETVIAYEFSSLRHRPLDQIGSSVEVRMRRADFTGDGADLEQVMRIDRAAFPWLWWNSEAEFRSYWFSPGVEIWIADVDDSPAGYIGLTSYPGWGHLDRIAVVPERQSKGIGTAMIRHAMAELRRLGAQRIGLSTQEENTGSRRLYERIGFRRMPEQDYRMFGRIFTKATEVEQPLEKAQVAEHNE